MATFSPNSSSQIGNTLEKRVHQQATSQASALCKASGGSPRATVLWEVLGQSLWVICSDVLCLKGRFWVKAESQRRGGNSWLISACLDGSSLPGLEAGLLTGPVLLAASLHACPSSCWNHLLQFVSLLLGQVYGLSGN